MNNFIVRAITGILFVAIVVTCFIAPFAMVVLFALVTGMTIWEFTGLVNNREGVKVNRFISTAAGVYFFLAVAGFCYDITPSAVFIPYLLTIVYLFISELYLRNEDAINDWAYTMMSQMYIALPFSCLNILAFREVEIIGDYEGSWTTTYGMLLPLSVFVFLWINDTGAYLSGSLFGKHKLFPRVSPGKSWEGSIGGGILVLAISQLLAMIDHSGLLSSLGLSDVQTGLSSLQWAGLGLVVVFFGTWGDLVESLLKRTLGVKDSGTILPGHGGMLDRFDSSLMAIPASVVYIYSISDGGIMNSNGLIQMIENILH